MISSVPSIFLYDVKDVVGKAAGKVRILGRFQIGDVEMAKVSPSLVEWNLSPNSFCDCESIKQGNSASGDTTDSKYGPSKSGLAIGQPFPRIDRSLRRNSR